MKLQPPFCTLQRYITAGTGPKLKKLPWDARRKGWELGCASCLISPVHILFKCWDLIELVTPLQQQHHQLVYQRPICKLKASPCFSSTTDIKQPYPKITSQVRQLAEKLPGLGGEQCTKQVSGTHCALISLLYSWLRAQNEPDTAPQSSFVSLIKWPAQCWLMSVPIPPSPHAPLSQSCSIFTILLLQLLWT